MHNKQHTLIAILETPPETVLKPVAQCESFIGNQLASLYTHAYYDTLNCARIAMRFWTSRAEWTDLGRVGGLGDNMVPPAVESS